ncbi:MAG: hypothetical protein IJ561_06225 [Ruminococcus sp.]|nr:hypothetical protein [Ruminococcus sp.]
MDKRRKIEEFLEYGGSELFSTLVDSGMTRGDGINALTELLNSYSEVCRFIKGRSAAYRYMLRKAGAKGMLGKRVPDLKKYRLTRAEKEHISKNVGEYIASGGVKRKAVKRAAGVVGVLIFAALTFWLVERYVYSQEYQEHMKGQFLIIENPKQYDDRIVFKISTMSDMQEIFLMELPTLYYQSPSGEIELVPKPPEDSSEEEKITGLGLFYTMEPEKLTLYGWNYGTSLEPGTYRAEFEFYIIDEKGEPQLLTATSKEAKVK